MIALDHVSVRLQGRTILEDLTLEIKERRLGVIGDNGSGKSTFARLLNGLLLPDEGQVTVDGLNTRSDGKEVRSKVGFLFQNPDSQIVMPTVAEDLALGLKPLRLDQDSQRQRIADTLEQFSLTHLAERSAHLLSGGEKQLVALAGVMITAPDILVCDEPTTLLDRRNAAFVTKTISALPCTVVVITHHVEHLSDFERVLLIENGRVTLDGEPGRVIPHYLDSVS